jgi:hypothetical protein
MSQIRTILEEFAKSGEFYPQAPIDYTHTEQAIKDYIAKEIIQKDEPVKDIKETSNMSDWEENTNEPMIRNELRAIQRQRLEKE